MRDDKEWQAEYMPKIRNMVTSQDNFILNKFPWAEFSAPPDVPLYLFLLSLLYLFHSLRNVLKFY